MISPRAAGALIVLAALMVGCGPSSVPSPSIPATPAPGATTSPTAPPTPVPTPVSTPSARPTQPAAIQLGPLAAGTYLMAPFDGPNAMGVCNEYDPTCTEDPADDSIRLTLTVPDGFELVHPTMVYSYPERHTGLIILRGANLYSRPCFSNPPPDIAVGPTVDEFANAIDEHPLLDATTPIDITLAGYSGKYIDLQLPGDIGRCIQGQFWPYEPGTYAHEPSQIWHLWILDVDGIRVVIQSMDSAAQSVERRTTLQAIVDSITIEK